MGLDAEHRQLVSDPAARFRDLTGAAAPIVQAPMAGAGGVALAVAAIRGGAVGSLPCAMLDAAQVREQAAAVRAEADGPLNLNFFCHALDETPDDSAWRHALAPFYAQEGVSPPEGAPRLRRPFDEALCAAVEAVRPEIVSFHFGLPAPALLARVKAVAKVFGNATTVDEARFLERQGCDAVIAQGGEAGGHAGWFLEGHRPVGTLALVRRIVRAVEIPVIAAGGIMDGAGIAAALTLGASAAQLGTAYLATPESLASPTHRRLLGSEAETMFTNVLTGREARGFRNRLIDALGPISSIAPAFPHAATALAPLRAAAEADGRGDYSPLWAGQGAALARPMPAETLTRALAEEALATLRG
ncbi:nitronate monooxygenase family protein [Sphingomonas psychrotolerans]|uniref:Propionate 3-nitronate monooxygenase n=1 Tax=Sphingomonas psychrotolerans TaxID=1327635 RepID=A0ABU3N5W3_9SPHN|nr:nitronate monooxygenase family protein [Sphingomonas psychrotolerans]MDT8758881.1 nitronate monooxygenase family protein [Sphingomonas psychrotolerans]